MAERKVQKTCGESEQPWDQGTWDLSASHYKRPAKFSHFFLLTCCKNSSTSKLWISVIKQQVIQAEPCLGLLGLVAGGLCDCWGNNFPFLGLRAKGNSPICWHGISSWCFGRKGLAPCGEGSREGARGRSLLLPPSEGMPEATHKGRLSGCHCHCGPSGEHHFRR